uniref:Two component transcriptional regulator, LytTR family n=1 Tax=Sphingobacterium sp. (strain 21) TaxID=743722 RepID=F4C9Y2_SPHS2
MKVLIVDDEPIAQDILEKFVARIPFLELLGKCDDAIEALTMIHDHKLDLVFLDIQMPEMTGLELVRVFSDHRPQVIFTTAFPQFALDGFNLEVCDYLLKPIPFERFLKAVNKAHEFFKLKQTAELGVKEEQWQDAGSLDDTYVWAKDGKKLVRFLLDDIVVVKALKDYMEVLLPDRRVTIHITMNRLENILCPPKFLRINRSCIVRKNAIRSIQDMRIETILQDEEKIIIGGTYWESLKAHFKELF